MNDWIILAALGAGGYYLWKKEKEEDRKSFPKVMVANEITPAVNIATGTLQGTSTIIRDTTVKRGGVIVFTLPSDAIGVTVVIYDAFGKAIRGHLMGDLKAGEHNFFWDGRTGKGELVGPGTYYSMVTCDYGKLPTGKIPVGGVHGCLENLVREGWDLSNAARHCKVELPAEANDPEVRDCIENMIREAASLGVALGGCKGLIYGPPSKTKPPEPTPTVIDVMPDVTETPWWELPPINGEKPPAGKAFPTWGWAVCILGGLLLLFRRK